MSVTRGIIKILFYGEILNELRCLFYKVKTDRIIPDIHRMGANLSRKDKLYTFPLDSRLQLLTEMGLSISFSSDAFWGYIIYIIIIIENTNQ